MLNSRIVDHWIFDAKVLQDSLSSRLLVNICLRIYYSIEPILMLLHDKGAHASHLEEEVVDDVSSLIKIGLLSE